MSGDKWAKVPHALILDDRVSAGAIRLYGRLCNYLFAHQRYRKALPKDLRLASDLNTSTRNIRRWRKELVDTGWAEFEYHGTVLAGLTLNDRTELSEDKSVRVLRPNGGPNPDPADESVPSADEEYEVSPVETGRNERIYSVPAPKNEGLELIPPDSTSDAVASAVAEGAPLDGAPEVLDWCEHLHRYRDRMARREAGADPGSSSFWTGEPDEWALEPTFDELYPRKAAA